MLTGLAVTTLVLIAAMAVPLSFSYRASWPAVKPNEAEIEWAFGLVRKRVTASGKIDKPSAGDKPKKKKSGDGRKRRTRRDVIAALRTESFRRRIIRFVRDLWRAVGKDDVRLRVRIGLGDPADTGQLWGILGPLSGMLATARDLSIVVEPEFVDATFEIDSGGRIRLIPLQIVVLVVALLLSPSIWRGVRATRAGG